MEEETKYARYASKCADRDESLEAIEKRGAKIDPSRGNCSWGTEKALADVYLLI